MTPECFKGLDPPYRTIVADPPWMYQKNPGDPRSQRNMAEHQYSTMTVEAIRDLPVVDLVADQAHLYLWVTNPQMFGGRFSSITPTEIAQAWGFDFKTLLTWVKPGGGGMGWYFRGQTEHVLFAVRGMLPIPSEKREPNVITAPRGRHSEKPGALYDLVERVSPGPYLELFARQPRLGWDSWGWGYEEATG